MQKELEEIRTRFERKYFESWEKSNGELKNTYALWLEREVVKKLNYIPCCKSDSELLYPNCQCKPTQKLGFCNECFDSIYSRA